MWQKGVDITVGGNRKLWSKTLRPAAERGGAGTVAAHLLSGGVGRSGCNVSEVTWAQNGYVHKSVCWRQ